MFSIDVWSAEQLRDAALLKAGVLWEGFCKEPPTMPTTWRHGWEIKAILIPGQQDPGGAEKYRFVVKPKSAENRQIWQQGQVDFFAKRGFTPAQAKHLATSRWPCKHELADAVAKHLRTGRISSCLNQRKAELVKRLSKELAVL